MFGFVAVKEFNGHSNGCKQGESPDATIVSLGNNVCTMMGSFGGRPDLLVIRYVHY